MKKLSACVLLIGLLVLLEGCFVGGRRPNGQYGDQGEHRDHQDQPNYHNDHNDHR
ncbi:MAG: hypothetical protein WBS54_10660 [Acidobacteriota bacterium]